MIRSSHSSTCGCSLYRSHITVPPNSRFSPKTSVPKSGYRPQKGPRLENVEVSTPKRAVAQKCWGPDPKKGRGSKMLGSHILKDAMMLAITSYTPRYEKVEQKMRLDGPGVCLGDGQTEAE